MEEFIADLGIVLVGASALSFLAVKLRQPIVIAYILCGVLVGPWGIGLIQQVEFLEAISRLGITLLLFLAGLCLHPQKLVLLFKKTVWPTFFVSAASFAAALLFARLFHFTIMDSVLIGLALMFSSTILVVKLLPTTKLHQQHMGAICIGVLIIQDLMAVAVLIFLRSLGSPQGVIIGFSLLILKVIALIGILFMVEQFVLRKIMATIERLHEALFVLGLAWCFGVATISHHMGLLYESGAFFAGVALARHPISLFISEKLKPLRDFFLVLFFFSLGAELDLTLMKSVLIPALLLSGLFIVMKPWLFSYLLGRAGEARDFSIETGWRLGQLSEFSLLIALLAFELGHISSGASHFIQLVTILTIIVSSYIVVYRFPTPIGISEKLIKD